MLIQIGDSEIEIDLSKVKYKDFLISLHYSFNKEEKIEYKDRNFEIFKDYVIKIAYKDEVDVSKINLNNISYINGELNFFGLPDIDDFHDLYIGKLYDTIVDNLNEELKKKKEIYTKGKSEEYKIIAINQDDGEGIYICVEDVDDYEMKNRRKIKKEKSNILNKEDIDINGNVEQNDNINKSIIINFNKNIKCINTFKIKMYELTFYKFKEDIFMNCYNKKLCGLIAYGYLCYNNIHAEKL